MMLVFWLCLGSMLWMLDTAVRRGRIQLLILETRDRLMGLRDDVQALAISGKVRDDYQYRVLTEILKDSAGTLESRNVFTITAFLLWDMKSPESCPSIEVRLDDQRHQPLIPFMKEYHRLMHIFYKRRNPLMVALGVRLFGKRINHRSERINRYDIKPIGKSDRGQDHNNHHDHHHHDGQLVTA